MGIGTDEPSYKLDVVGTGRMASVIFSGDSTEQTTAYTNQEVAVSGWANATFVVGGDTNAKILANSASGVAISGWAGKTITNEINSLVDAAPGALNTLNELAAALDDDANFATTITNSIAANTTKITANSASGVAISGWASSSFTGHDGLAADILANSVSGVAISGMANSSGDYLLGLTTTNASNITSNTTNNNNDNNDNSDTY